MALYGKFLAHFYEKHYVQFVTLKQFVLKTFSKSEYFRPFF